MKKSISLFALLALLLAACAPQAQPVAVTAEPTSVVEVVAEAVVEAVESLVALNLLPLEGAQEVPAVETAATGIVNVSLVGNILTVDGTFQDLSSDLIPIAGTPAHIHIAPVGENGPVVFPLEVEVDINNALAGTFMGTFTLEDAQVEEFRAGLYYVNIHTVLNPGGELRGQLMAMDM